ncbi:uncharacterized protein LOC123552528 isoform X2 [Mercenaria mercenaria]|uniref:uncharacterized protein LOC123552528 isoform X2 n=1 Tax=Mercenaria mercenaria TaxID=6596 RepID=UPI00234F05AF|nr:uncharacterized protein LOC123552528 isoform X2 [Mercenaria mercenaria]
MLLSAAVVVFITIQSSTVGAETNTEAESTLTFLNSFPYNSVYRYQARCTLPCSGSHRPGEFKVTISLDKICSNFESFGNFKPAQTSQSAVWYLNNTNWINSNTQGQCQFDVQFDYSPQKPVPTGTCKLGWESPNTCLIDDVVGTVMYGWMTCFNVAALQLGECYNQTLFSQCCNSCNDHRLTLDNCPFGDLRPWECTSLRDDNCYDSSIEQNCCNSCNERAQNRDTEIDGCTYGDKDPYFCSTITEEQCYRHESTCCDTCYWMSDTNTPDCLYGNKKPDLCDTIATYQCYNKTVQNDCCRLCNELRNDNDPDCLYGDRQPMCNSIERNDCYRTATLETCCETCVQSADNNYPDCAYGDRRECSDITIDDCSITTGSIQTDCCQTCRFLQENNCVAHSWNEEQGKCYNIESRECYNEYTRSQCCFTCNDYYAGNTHLGENCKYGDRTPNQCIKIDNGTECYANAIEKECCETCSYYEISSLPTHCRYGDKEDYCRQIPPYECYDTGVLDVCCETCPSYDQSDTLGSACRYGDRRDDCYERGSHKCYNPDDRRECCRFCQNVENKDNVGCEFGDKEKSCSNIVAKDCYTRENTCCETCPTKVSIYNIENCEYGDRANCSGISDNACYDSNTAFKCCETCWLRSNGNTGDCAFGDLSSNCGAINQWDCYFRENECCETCGNLQSPVSDLTYCKYGDRNGGCGNITADQCYNQNTLYQCCETCYYKRRTDLPDTCLYGDKTRSCQSTKFHSSECYDGNRRDQCCETCRDLQTSDQNCEYEDKNIQCKDVGMVPHFCYNITVENACCYSCPQLSDPTHPGCEYGDTYQYCDVTRCGDYPPFRHQECCNTCWDYDGHSTGSTTLSYSTPSSSPSSSSSTTESSVPGEEEERSSSNTLPIVGGVIGGVLVIAVIIIAACFVMRRNKNKEKQGNKFSNLTDINAQPHNRNAPSNLNGFQRNPALGNPGYNSRVKGNMPPQNRPPPKSQDSKQDEEVYDYIDDSDVRSMPSIKRPSVPERTEADGATANMEPTPNGKAEYFNPTFQNDSTKDYHTYHVLQKDDVEREYMKL